MTLADPAAYLEHLDRQARRDERRARPAPGLEIAGTCPCGRPFLIDTEGALKGCPGHDDNR